MWGRCVRARSQHGDRLRKFKCCANSAAQRLEMHLLPPEIPHLSRRHAVAHSCSLPTDNARICPANFRISTLRFRSVRFFFLITLINRIRVLVHTWVWKAVRRDFPSPPPLAQCFFPPYSLNCSTFIRHEIWAGNWGKTIWRSREKGHAHRRGNIYVIPTVDKQRRNEGENSRQLSAYLIFLFFRSNARRWTLLNYPHTRVRIKWTNRLGLIKKVNARTHARNFNCYIFDLFITDWFFMLIVSTYKICISSQLILFLLVLFVFPFSSLHLSRRVQYHQILSFNSLL